MGRIIYTPEMREFIQQNYKGRYTDELTKLFNERFGVDFSVKQIKEYKIRWRLKSGLPNVKPKGYGRVFTKEVAEYIFENHKGVGPTKMTAVINKKFGVAYTVMQVASFYTNNKLDSGLTGRFEKGHIPYNKGMKGTCAPGSEKGWFKKGNVPKTCLPVGTETVTKDGYVRIKIAEPNVWKLKHRYVWEKYHGKIPKKHIIIFRDGDRKNCSIENLRMIDRSVRLMINRSGMGGCIGERQDIATAFAETKIAIVKAKKRTRQNRKEG